uniref:TOBE domain-containing protein n=1 Tax=Cognatishimia sp. TaxID=2211648 RepID=UPI0035141576
GGHIEQVGSPIDLYERPQNTFVAQFIGSPKMNFFSPANLSAQALQALGVSADSDTIIGIRSEHMKLSDASDAKLSARFEIVENLGELALVHMKTADGVEFIVKLETPPNVMNGDELHFSFADEKVHLFDAKTGERQN